MEAPQAAARLVDLHPDDHIVSSEVLAGLCTDPKSTSPKLLYDDRGAMLFDQICSLEEYYLTRTELAIMEQNVRDMARCLGSGCVLIEYGSGEATKVRLILEALDDPSGYVPIDISRQQLLRVSNELKEEFQDLDVVPVCADFTQPLPLPTGSFNGARRIGYMPGSTIGNFHPEEAQKFLGRVRSVCSSDGGALVGVDLKKDRETLVNAYDDAEGVTAEFNRNLLRRLNREMGADFDLNQFSHRAHYNEERSRVEMHLVSQTDQTVRVGGERIRFENGESIHTENSYKYSKQSFRRLAAGAGWDVEQVWTDDRDLFSVQYLTAS